MYNIMNCSGFDTGVMGSCSLAWLVFGLLLFIVLISNRQLDNFGLEYNMIGGFAGAIIPYLIIITLFGSFKWGLFIGLIGSLAGGIFGATFFGGTGGEGGGEGWY